MTEVVGFEEIVEAEFIRETSGVLQIAPADTEQTAAVMRVCAERKLVVTATGSGTKLGWGNPVTAPVLLETSRMSGVREHSWQDLTATVGAGTTWAEMQQVLGHQSQRVALDPLFAGRATVGGVLATNDSGLLRMRYGSLRDLVLGMTIVLADGTIARTGGKVVKNVAGYDLPKLMTGSFGTLGVITEATFRLHPLQPTSAAWTVLADDVAPLATVMHQLVNAAMSIEAMQLRNLAGGFALDVLFSAVPEGLAEHQKRLQALASGLVVQPGAPGVFESRSDLFSREAETVLKITLLPSKLAAVVAGFAELERSGCEVRCLADSVGIVTVAMAAPPSLLATIVDDLRARLRPSGGAVFVLQRGALPATVTTWGDAPAAIGVMQAIKQEFDPSRLLNPGKFVGGL